MLGFAGSRRGYPREQTAKLDRRTQRETPSLSTCLTRLPFRYDICAAARRNLWLCTHERPLLGERVTPEDLAHRPGPREDTREPGSSAVSASRPALAARAGQRGRSRARHLPCRNRDTVQSATPTLLRISADPCRFAGRRRSPFVQARHECSFSADTEPAATIRPPSGHYRTAPFLPARLTRTGNELAAAGIRQLDNQVCIYTRRKKRASRRYMRDAGLMQ
jgi:hypothetical protein